MKDFDPRLAHLTLAYVERNHIEKMVRDCNGNLSLAAKVLGLHRRSLQRKLRRIRLSRR